MAAFRLYSVPLAGECGGTWGREKRLIGKEKEVFLQKKNGNVIELEWVSKEKSRFEATRETRTGAVCVAEAISDGGAFSVKTHCQCRRR